MINENNNYLPMKLKLYLFIFLLFGFSTIKAQYSLCGSVTEEHLGKEGISVRLLHTRWTSTTNKKGNFCFYNLPPGEYSLEAFDKINNKKSSVYKILLTEDISGIELNISLVTKTVDEINITGKKNTKIGQQSISVGVVDLTKEARSAVTVEQLMNRSAGIRVRNSGGLGAEADIVVGGFNGKSVKFLLDGIPVDYLGTSMGLTKIPTNAADYIEVYKGVMPTEIGVDALGGAINIVSKKPSKTGATAGYEIGSFNTHRFTLNAFYRKSEKFSAGVNTFFNYSTNNFKVDNLPIEDPETGRTQYIRAPLFHNGYLQNSGEAFINFENRNWADLLRFKINTYSIKREIQNDFSSRARPFGGVYRTEDGYAIPSLEYKKKLFSEKLELSQFFVYSDIRSTFNDPLKNVRYDWLGNPHQTISGGETGIDMSNIEGTTIYTRLQNFTYRGLFSYQLGEAQKLIFNLVNNYYHQTGDDLNTYKTKNIIQYNRLIAGLGYQYGLFNKKVEGLTQVKFLQSTTEGKYINNISRTQDIPVQNAGWSIAQSLKYNFSGGWLIRASLENTYRLPDQMEIFGDNIFIIPNLQLKPERSLNINLGARFQKNNKYKFEINTYYRNVKDLIRLKDITQFTSMFLNLDKVRGYGIELEGMIRPFSKLELSGNLTYNDFRFKGSNENISKNSHFINARVSNMPFYFGNAAVSYRFENFFSPKSGLQVYWNYSYVHQYYLDFIEKQYEPDGFLGLFGASKVFTNRIIPIQQVHSAGFVWTFERAERKKIAVSTEINNIFDVAIYNNFKMQSAGRNYSAKVSFDL